MPPRVLWDSPKHPRATIVLAHGAGGAMDSKWMNDVTALLVDRGIRVSRFEFAYMASRRDGLRKPPPRGDSLVGEYRDAVAEIVQGAGTAVTIGGKSMGGRVASLVADELFARGAVRSLVCLGYPFHPPGKPEKVRTAHLADLHTPTLICQGTRDIFGGPDDVAGYSLSSAITVRWFEDGDHGLKPRKGGGSGFTEREYLATAADAIAEFITRKQLQ